MHQREKAKPEYIREKLRQTPIDLVVSDLDGTLLHPARHVPAAVVEAVKRFKKSGVRFMVASGGPNWAVLNVIETLQIDEPYIAGGGAYIADPRKDQIIQHTPLSRETVEAIVLLARQSGVSIVFEEPEIIYLEATDAQAAAFEKFAEIQFSRADDILSISSEPITKIALIGDSDIFTTLDPALDALSGQAHIATSFPHIRDITAIGVNKGVALQKLAGYVEIPSDRILVIGDGWNDKSMFDIAGLAVAVANATQDVLEIVDLIVPSNAEYGVAWLLDQIIDTRSDAQESTPARIG